MTRNEAIQLPMKPPFKSTSYESIMKAYYLSFINTIYDDFEQQICDNCKHNYCECFVQGSILQIYPEASFHTFGCNEFVPCK